MLFVNLIFLPTHQCRSLSDRFCFLVVAAAALLTLIIFAILTFRYRLVRKGSYRVDEFKMDEIKKNPQSAEALFNQAPSKEFML